MRALLAALAVLALPGTGQAKERQDWRLRLEAPQRWVVDWAAKNPGSILMTSNQSGTFQLYGVDLKRGRATTLTEEPAGKRYGSISPDGESVLFVKDVMGNEIGQIFRVPARGGKGEPLIPDFPSKSIWEPRWGSGGKNVYFDASDRSGFGVYQYQIGGRRAFTVYFSTLEVYDAAPSMDERYVSFVHNNQRNDRIMDVHVVDLRTGGPAGLLALGPGTDEAAGDWAREGDLGRALVASDASGRVVPGIWEVATGSVTWLETSIEGDVTPEDWFPGGKEVLLLQTHRGRTALWRYNLETRTTESVAAPEGKIDAPRVRPDGSIWLRFESSERPPDYYALEKGALRAVLPDPPNAKLRVKPMTGHRAESVSFKSADGTEVQGWLAKAAGPSAGRAAVILLHRGPQTFAGNAWDPVQLALTDHGYVTLHLNYRGSTSFGKPFEADVAGDPGRLELEDLAAAREWLIREHGVTASSVALAGEYYGGYLALLATGRQPELWAAAYSFGGVADLARMYEDASEPLRGWCRQMLGGDPESAERLYADRSPITHTFTIKAPLLLIHGSDDSRTPRGQMDAFVARLKDAGKVHRYLTFAGGHGAPPVPEQIRFLDAFLDFLHQSGLGPPPQR